MELETIAEDWKGNAALEANYNAYYFGNAEGGIMPYDLQTREYRIN